MSKWITDRVPTEEDADSRYEVWATYKGKVVTWTFDAIVKGTPWMPITKPQPYVEPLQHDCVSSKADQLKMSEWITDRLPTIVDCAGVKGTAYYDCVWTMVAGCVVTDCWYNIEPGIAWQPIAIEKPQPYVALLRFTVAPNALPNGRWAVEYDKIYVADNIPTREAAERIAAIYNEVMP